MERGWTMGCGVLCAAWAVLAFGCASPQEIPPDFQSPGDDDHLYVAPSGPCEPGTQRECMQFSCAGTRTCTDQRVWGACDTGATTETCDGVDNDCDGIVDNPAGGCGQKTCDTGATQTCATATCRGERTCTEGEVWGACDTGSSTEVCDGIDNDCDGVIDNVASGSCEAATCTTGQTRACNRYACGGTETCVGGKWSGVCSVQATAEVCDGKDNDCDGVVDDNIAPTSCSGACGQGVTSCVNGATMCSSAKEPTAEVCDNIDNDCDGVVDNIAPKACSTACGGGTAYCSNGAELCNARQPSAEVCDDVDNDCDGTNNEGVGNACGGCGPVPAEVPNGTDDNCDGQVDEGYGLVPVYTTWAALQAQNFGCYNGFSNWWQCQQVADTFCKERGYLGGYGPVDWDDNGGSGVWVECVGQGHGASIARINPLDIGVSYADSQARRGEETVRKWCFGRGFGAAVGTIRWYGDGTVDVMCLPANYGGYYQVSAQLLTDRGCGEVGALWTTPICSRAGQRICRDVYGREGIPFWVWGNVGMLCFVPF